MPFKKTGKNEWTSPSGRKWNRKQMESYKSRKGSSKSEHKRKDYQERG